MKKLTALLSFFILLTAFTCENEPLEGDFTNEDPTTSCVDATQATTEATLDFAFATDETYEELCTAYKAALITQITACGDTDGSLQTIVDALGDCSNDNPVDDCELAELATQNAQEAFDNATDDNYTPLCNALVLALENQIAECDDIDGSLQTRIDDLGDCTNDATNPAGIISVTVGTLAIEFDVVNVVIAGSILQVTGETSSTANDNMVYFEVEEDTTGMEIINSEFVLTLSTTDPDYFPSTVGFDDFTSTITENEMGTLVGTFGGVVTNSSGADLSLTQGIIDIEY